MNFKLTDSFGAFMEMDIIMFFLWVLCFPSCFSISVTESLRLSLFQFPSGQRDSSNPALRGTNEQDAAATWTLVPAN